MKTKAILPLAAAATLLIAGCATPVPVGVVYTGVTLPVAVTSNSGASPKVGTAECSSYFGLIAVGDASLDAAKKAGGITKVHHVDWDAQNVLGIIGKYKVTVYGE